MRSELLAGGEVDLMDANLLLLKKDGSQKAFPLPSSVTIIGRRHDCDLRAPLMSVSRRHCQFSNNDGGLTIRDLNSRNGTYLNGKRVEHAELKAGDRIKVGPLMFVIQIDGQPKEVLPPTSAAKKLPKKEKPAEQESLEELGDSFADLDESGSFVDLGELDESDSSLDDLKDI